MEKLENNLTVREDRVLRVTSQIVGHNSSRCPTTIVIYPYSWNFEHGCWRLTMPGNPPQLIGWARQLEVDLKWQFSQLSRVYLFSIINSYIE